MYHTSASGLVETSGSAEGVKDSVLMFRTLVLALGEGGGELEVWLGLPAASGLKVVDTTTLGTYLAICGAVILSCFSEGIFAMALFPSVRTCFIVVVNFAALEILLFAMVASVPWVSKRCPADLLPASLTSMN